MKLFFISLIGVWQRLVSGDLVNAVRRWSDVLAVLWWTGQNVLENGWHSDEGQWWPLHLPGTSGGGMGGAWVYPWCNHLWLLLKQKLLLSPASSLTSPTPQTRLPSTEVTPSSLCVCVCVFSSVCVWLMREQKQKNIAGALAFWMANASELLNFIKQDRDLSRISLDAQDILAHLVQMAFKSVWVLEWGGEGLA